MQLTRVTGCAALFYPCIITQISSNPQADAVPEHKLDLPEATRDQKRIRSAAQIHPVAENTGSRGATDR